MLKTSNEIRCSMIEGHRPSKLVVILCALYRESLLLVLLLLSRDVQVNFTTGITGFLGGFNHI